MALIYIIRIYLLMNIITMSMQQAFHSFQLPSSKDTNAYAQLIPHGLNTLMKMASN